MQKGIVTKIMNEYRDNEGKALERLEQILEIAKDDEVSLSLAEKLMESAERYFQSVVSMERKVKLAKYRLEGKDLRDLIQSLDTTRHLAHNALLDNVAILNRYLFKEYGIDTVPAGGVYSEDPETIRDRAAVGDWAGKLLFGLYVNRKR